MKLNNYKVIFLMADSVRSKYYLNEFKKENFFFKHIIFLGKRKSFLKYKSKINKQTIFEHLNVNSINSKIAYKKINAAKNNLIFYSGFPGEKISKKILKTKNIFLHAHTGNLPKYKGSTTFYYSMIKDSHFYVSLMIINENIDQGIILFKKKFVNFKNENKKLSIFEIKARAKTFLDFIRNFKQKNIKFMKNNNHLITYYFIAHPIIRFFGQKKYEKQV